jgi:hypothetical protein
MTDKQREANRRNALHSTGPKTLEGTERCKMNALRHGLRAVQVVAPGENPEDWQAHRDALVNDLDPVGAMELALAEIVAAKLWRLGRVLAYEADLITNAQTEDELMHVHERIYQREFTTPPTRADIPTRDDVASARTALEAADTKLTEQTEALDQLQALDAMGDDEVFPSPALYERLCAEFSPSENDLQGLFEGAAMILFRARHAKQMILICCKGKGELDELQVTLAAQWASQLEQLQRDVNNRQAEHESLARRYEHALERRRVAAVLPEAKDIDRIQRYESHLERGLHRDLDRLHQLKEARGAVPPRGPSVAVAVVQASPQPTPQGQMAPFGSFAVEAPEGEMASIGSFDLEPAEITEEPAGVDGQG